MISNDSMKDKIYVYDVFTELYDSKNEQFRLLPNELYLYCFLYRNRSHDYITKINVESIHQSMPVKFKPSKATKNRVEIKNNLLSLRSKGIIHFNLEAESLYSKSGNYKSLDITFEKFTERKGYLQVSYSDFDSMDNIEYFYIKVAVERFRNVKTISGYYGRWISENEFGKLLGTTGKTFQNKANQMITKGLLYKASGRKKGNSNEQDKNVYNVIPFGFESKKIAGISNQNEPDVNEIVPPNETKQTIIPEFIEVSISHGKNKVSLTHKFNTANLKADIFKWGSDMGYEHYYFAYKYKDTEPQTYVQYQRRRKVMESKGGTFTQHDLQFAEDMKWEKILAVREQKRKLAEEHGYFFIFENDTFGTIKDITDWGHFKFKDIGTDALNTLDLDDEDEVEKKQFVMEKIKETKQLDKQALIKILQEYGNNNDLVITREVEPDKPFVYKRKKDDFDISHLLDDEPKKKQTEWEFPSEEEIREVNSSDQLEDFSELETDDPCLKIFVDIDKEAKENILNYDDIDPFDEKETPVKRSPHNAWLHELKAKRQVNKE